MTDTMRRLTVADCIALIGEDSAFVRDDVMVTFFSVAGFRARLETDPLLPPGVIEIRDRDRVLGRIFGIGGAS